MDDFLLLRSRPWRWDSVIGGHMNFWMVMRGEALLDLNGKSYELKPGTGFVFFPGDVISGRSISEGVFENFALHFQGGRSSGEVPEATRERLRATATAQPGVFFEMFRYGFSLQADTEACDSGLRERLGSQMLEIFWRDAQRDPVDPMDRRMRRQAEAIAFEPEKFWEVNSLADELHLSRAHYYRRFFRLLGQSPKQYVLRCRIERAMTLLREGSVNVQEVAASLGYSDVFYFSKQFKSKTGLSPSQFRRGVRPGTVI